MHTANKKTNISHGGATCTSICLLWADYITTNINLLITLQLSVSKSTKAKLHFSCNVLHLYSQIQLLLILVTFLEAMQRIDPC